MLLWLVCVCLCVYIWALEEWGELASQKRQGFQCLYISLKFLDLYGELFIPLFYHGLNFLGTLYLQSSEVCHL